MYARVTTTKWMASDLKGDPLRARGHHCIIDICQSDITVHQSKK